MDDQIEWVLTDSDSLQYGRKLEEDVYEFREFDRNNYAVGHNEINNFLRRKENFYNTEIWIQEKIVLADYSEKQIENYISPYYKSLKDLKNLYSSDWKWIVAECIFEQESGLY